MIDIVPFRRLNPSQKHKGKILCKITKSQVR